MTFDPDKKRQAFQFLDNTDDLDDKKIEQCFNEHTLSLVGILLSELTEEEGLPDQLTQAKFTKLIRELRAIKRMWGRKLGDAIILSGDKADTGDYETAISILSEFIKDCSSLYFRGHAQNQLLYYKETLKKATQGE